MLRVVDLFAAIWGEDETGRFIYLSAQLRLSIDLV